MPRNFTLTRIGSRTPSHLTDVDLAICAHFEVGIGDWRGEWYDYIGFLLAMGKDYKAITEGLNRMIAQGDYREWAYTMRAIVHFLMENYISEARWEPK